MTNPFFINIQTQNHEVSADLVPGTHFEWFSKFYIFMCVCNMYRAPDGKFCKFGNNIPVCVDYKLFAQNYPIILLLPPIGGLLAKNIGFRRPRKISGEYYPSSPSISLNFAAILSQFVIFKLII